MNIQFPLVRSPGTIVLVDDVTTMNESLNLSLPEEWNIKSFTQIHEFLDYMNLQMGMIKQMDAFFQGAVDRYRKTGNVLIEVLRYWNSFPERYSIPQVVIVDYFMQSKMTGIELLDACSAWNGGRILLTGLANEKTVMDAFNGQRIDRYIPKQTPKLGSHIATNIVELLDKFAISQSMAWNPWFISMTPDKLLVLNSPDSMNYVREFATSDYEYVALGSPFGILALGSKGDLKWLQMERTSTLDEAADLAVKMGVSDDEATQIRAGKAISDVRLLAALNSTAKPTVTPVAFSTKVAQDHDMLLGASFVVNSAGAPSPDMCFAGWFSRQPERI